MRLAYHRLCQAGAYLPRSKPVVVSSGNETTTRRGIARHLRELRHAGFRFRRLRPGMAWWYKQGRSTAPAWVSGVMFDLDQVGEEELQCPWDSAGDALLRRAGQDDPRVHPSRTARPEPPQAVLWRSVSAPGALALGGPGPSSTRAG